jgi:hypothetical protein
LFYRQFPESASLSPSTSVEAGSQIDFSNQNLASSGGSFLNKSKARVGAYAMVAPAPTLRQGANFFNRREKRFKN